MSSTMLATLILLSGPPALASGAESPMGAGQLPTTIEIKNCLVNLVEDVSVPARAAGVLTQLNVDIGNFVREQDVVAELDSRDIKLRLKAAKKEADLARVQSESVAGIHAAEATAGVAASEHQMALDIEAGRPGAYARMELERLKLTKTRAEAQATLAIEERDVAVMTAEVRAAQVEAAEHELSLRQVPCPLDGVVVEKFHNAGEWVNVGEPILRVVRMDELRVEGNLDVSKYLPSDVIGMPVTIYVRATDTRTIELEAVIDYASPIVDGVAEQFTVHARVKGLTPDEKGQWVVRPGLPASMTIHLNR